MDERRQFRAEVEGLSDGSGVVVLEGEVDIYTAPRFMEALTSAFEQGAWRLIIDMQQMSFIDSRGLGVLVTAVRQVQRHDGALVIVCTDDTVLRVLEITGLDDVITVCPTRDAARAFLEERAET